MAALAAAGGGGVSGGSGLVNPGSEERNGGAHRVRGVVVMLKVVVARRGAHGGDGNRSPELRCASGSYGRRRGRGYKACQCKIKGALDA